MAPSKANQPFIDPREFQKCFRLCIFICQHSQNYNKKIPLDHKDSLEKQNYLHRHSQELSFEEELECLCKDKRVQHTKINNFLAFISDYGVI